MRRIFTISIMLVFATVAFVVTGVAQESTPEAADRSVTIGQTLVSWPDAWEYAEDGSSEEIATLVAVDEQAGRLMLATYAEMVDETVDSAAAALDVFAESFLNESGVSDTVEEGSGELDNGMVWKTFTYELQGVEVITLFAVSHLGDNAFVVSSLTGMTGAFEEAVTQAQEEILLNDEPVFLGGIDADAVARASATPIVGPEATTQS